MTQSLLLAAPNTDMAPVTEGAVVGPVNARSAMAERHLRGDIAELLFCIAARERGYGVKWMQGNCKGYDVIIERYGQKPLFVQVKCSNPKPGNNWYAVSNNVGGVVYAPHAYDALALYMWDRGEWVFYTREDLGNRTATTYTPPEMRRQATGSGSPPARSPNNWHLLDEVAESLTAHQKSFNP